jgi:hypothetical protein
VPFLKKPKRIDYFRFTDASGDQETGFKKLVGGNIKAGIILLMKIIIYL